MPESFKFDVRVRERLLRKGEITEAEIEKNLEGLPDATANSVTIELKQPAFQTDAERAENAVVVRVVPPRPISLAAPINLDEEEDDEDEEPLPRKPAAVEKVAAEKTPEKAAAKSDVDEDKGDEEDEDEDDEDDEDEDEDEDDEEAEGGEKSEDAEKPADADKEDAPGSDDSGEAS